MHRKIGILGGVTPESTLLYYQYITRTYVERYRDFSYPEIIIYSVNFQQIKDWTKRGRWDKAVEKMIEVFKRLHQAGADFGLIAANTPHKVFDEVQKGSPIPLISIIDATAEAIHEKGLNTVGLLGTIYTMSEDFYKVALRTHGITALVPDAQDQAYINKIIYKELATGKIYPESKKGFLAIIDRLKAQGAEGVILGCTEIPLLIHQEDCDIPVFNTTVLHADKALEYAVKSETLK